MARSIPRVMLIVAAVLFSHAGKADEAPSIAKTFELSAIDRVWSAHEARFAILEGRERIYVGYYDANRQLTLASRARDAQYWIYAKLDSWTGWDSHNYVALGMDEDGNLHVSANMHNDPLNYWKTGTPGDIRTARRVPTLVDGELERRMTYPVFLKDADGRLVFKYRDGGSGNGNEIYVGYDARTHAFRHLLATPLVDGEGRRNAYFVGPTLGPDGWFHLAWVWRDTPDASTNHDLPAADISEPTVLRLVSPVR